MPEFKTLLDDLCFPEGPRWHDGRFWFSDMHDHKVIAVDMAGNAETIVEVPTQPSGLGWTPDGKLLIVSMTDRKLLRLDDDGLTEVGDMSKIAQWHCNDMVVDARGNAYVGNFGFNNEIDPPEYRKAEIILVTADGEVRTVVEDVAFPNGTVITPDGKTMIVGETYGGRLTAFDIEDDGSLINRREWAKTTPAVPDGICLDAEGAIWIASPSTNDCIRIKEGGEVTDRIPVSTSAFACMLGGPDGRTLFAATAESSGAEATKVARAGKIEIAEVEVPHAGLP